MIKVRFCAIPNRKAWRAVCVPIRTVHLPACRVGAPCRCRTSPPLCVGFVRWSVAAQSFVARLRRRTDCEPLRVRSFFTNRKDAAEWILLTGGYAQLPKQVLEVAA
jgi:hypothetical protein